MNSKNRILIKLSSLLRYFCINFNVNNTKESPKCIEVESITLQTIVNIISISRNIDKKKVILPWSLFR